MICSHGHKVDDKTLEGCFICKNNKDQGRGLTWDQIEALSRGEPVNNKINVKRWTGFMATFQHKGGENGGMYRSFGDSIDEVVESIRKRPDPSVKNAIVYCEPSAIPPGENTIEPMTRGPGRSYEEIQASKRERFARTGGVSSSTEKIACAVCGKEEPLRHPGHFMCGNSTCREALIGSHKAASRALTFLSGLNLQDHSTKEQKELVEVVHLLLKATKPTLYAEDQSLRTAMDKKDRP